MERDLRVPHPEDPGWPEIRRLWGAKLAPIHPDLVRQDVSDYTRSFLTKVGLPTERQLDIMFFRDDRLLGLVSVSCADYLALAEAYGAILGVKVGTDELWSVDPKGILPRRFVNSRISDFLSFLMFWASQKRDLQEADDKQLEPMLREIRRELTSRDVHALDDENSWWSCVLEQVLYCY